MDTAGDKPASRPSRTLLLVDDEESILASLKRLLRREGYTILAANSGDEGLRLLGEQPVDVIVSDQRMPQMTGVEFLRRVKTAYPDTVRIVLSGYTELQSITDAINEGAIYKFLTKPWDDEQLRANIQEAFAHKELADENRRLSEELGEVNAQLRGLLAEKQRQSQRDQAVLGVVQEILQQLPLPVVGLDDEGLIVCANEKATALLGDGQPLVGGLAGEVLPATLRELTIGGDGETIWRRGGDCWRVRCCTVGIGRMPRGRLLVLSREGEA